MRYLTLARLPSVCFFSLYQAVKELIKRELGIAIALTTTGYYLRSWGYSPQKPKKKAYEQNPKAVRSG